jgi:hypothetical protein
MIVNFKTANMFGLTVPLSLLAARRGDRITTRSRLQSGCRISFERQARSAASVPLLQRPSDLGTCPCL